MIPYTIERRADTGVNNVTLGMWLFIASEVMLFGALFSAYALLSVAAPDWPSGRQILSLPIGAANTVVLLNVTAFAWRSRTATPAAGRWMLVVSTVFALVFLGFKTIEYSGEIRSGLVPSASTFLGIYFTLTGLHALHVVAGVVANLWALAGAARAGEAMMAGRRRALAIYWLFVDTVWMLIFLLLYLW